jgi:hypothetical protein
MSVWYYKLSFYLKLHRKYRNFDSINKYSWELPTGSSTLALQILLHGEGATRLGGYQSSQWQTLPESALSWLQLPIPGIVSRSVEILFFFEPGSLFSSFPCTVYINTAVTGVRTRCGQAGPLAPCANHQQLLPAAPWRYLITYDKFKN